MDPIERSEITVTQPAFPLIGIAYGLNVEAQLEDLATANRAVRVDYRISVRD